MLNLTPQGIVSELDRFVIGQTDAKRAVAIALRNRWRRKMITDPIKDEIVPHNILMVGPTGVGKTEIARRLAKLTKSPFLKVEATKFTEVGYVGRDVESIIRDLMDIAINDTKEEMRKSVLTHASQKTMEKLLTVIVGKEASEQTRKKFANKLQAGELDETEVEIEVTDNPSISGAQTFDIPGGQMGLFNLGDMINKMVGDKKKKLVKLKIKDAYEYLLKEESDNCLDQEQIVKAAIRSVEEEGIVFLDEIDKITSRSGSSGSRGEVSREGVQRDLLPLIEGTIVNTKYGTVKTNHILFIASGAFHIAKPADLLPELQGRLPVRVQLQPLSLEDMVRILKEPENSLLKQYQALFRVEGVSLLFTEDGITAIAETAITMNDNVENIGARRLHTILEKLLESISFTAIDAVDLSIEIGRKYVDEHLKYLINSDQALSNFIL